MQKLVINGKEYKVKFGYNSFCDTDLMERTNDLMRLLQGGDVKSDEDVQGIGKVKELFVCVRELLFVGFEKYNPLESIREVGDLLDDYMDEETNEKRGLLELFTILAEELMNEGFLADLLKQTEEMEQPKKEPKKPQDHKKATK